MLSLESQFKRLNLGQKSPGGIDSAWVNEQFENVRSLVRIVATNSGE